MTFNLVANYFTSTRDFGIITNDPGQVAEIENVFEADWNQTTVYPSQPDLVWSPTNSREKIDGVIAGAKYTLDVYNEEDSDPVSMQDLENAAQQRHVQVRFITADLSSGKGVDGNAAERSTLNENGVDARMLNSPNYIHAKMVLADYGTANALAYLGSENFSKTSLDKNRELGILLHGNQTTILQSLETTFNGDWALTQPDSDGAATPAKKPTKRKKAPAATASMDAQGAQAADTIRANIKPAEFFPEP
jgi:cardiolipin synthase A/B